MRKLLVVVLAAAASGACSSSTGSSGNIGGGNGGTDGTGGNGATGGDGTGSTGGGTGSTDGGTTTAACTGKTAQPLDTTVTIQFGGQDRTFDVHVPKSYDPGKPTPLVLNFHGFTSNSSQQNLLAKMDDKSDMAGFIAVHPNGTNNSWNAGACCGQAVSDNVDDVGFVRAMLDKLEAELCVDTNRVFATGMSNGGFLSHRLGCELADRIAAVAPVAGVNGLQTCNPSRPMPIMHFHGTADPLVPYNGNPQMKFIPVEQSFADWGKRDGCTDMPTETFRNGDSHCATYQKCAGGVEVTLCTVDNGGHTWPGGTPVPSLGYTTTYLSATDAMWTFFQKHPLK